MATILEQPEMPPRMNFEEFLEWADEDTHAEWVDGEVIIMSPAEDIHQLTMGWLVSLLGTYVQEHDLGTLLPAPFLMRLVTRPSGREPDLLFVAKQNLDRLTPTYLNGPADLAIEIVSPDSQERDRVTKFAEYAGAGVREYWLLDHSRNEAEFYILNAQGVYERLPIDTEGKFHSLVLPGLWLEVNWLWQRPLPRQLAVLRLWGLI